MTLTSLPMPAYVWRALPQRDPSLAEPGLPASWRGLTQIPRSFGSSARHLHGVQTRLPLYVQLKEGEAASASGWSQQVGPEAACRRPPLKQAPRVVGGARAPSELLTA
jgi:hypothetical protein